MNKIALIIGITGQDGSYLAELLLSKGYEVHGIIRRSSSFNTGRIDHIFNQLKLHYGDVTDLVGLIRIFRAVNPDEIYNLAAQSHVAVSFEVPIYTGQVDAIGVLNVIEAAKESCKYSVRIYQASSSEMFGSSPAPQSETTAFMPCSPYGAAKVYAFHICKNYRESYSMYISNGILFNHESPRRGGTFVTKKLVQALIGKRRGEIKTPIRVGNLFAKRDWGHAKDYVRAMWLMLQQEHPDDYVIATGETHTVKEFIDEVMVNIVGTGFYWKDIDLYFMNELWLSGFCPEYIRPKEVDVLQGDYSKARNVLGWKPEYTFKTLVEDMIDHELQKS